MAGHIGQRVAGFLGMLNAVLASIVPTIIGMVILLASLSAIKDQPWVEGMTQAVLPVVGVMMAVLTWQFFRKAQEGLGWMKSLIFVAGSFILIEVLPSPAILIGAILVFVLIKPAKRKIDQTTAKKEESL
jgi:chromate transporter